VVEIERAPALPWDSLHQLLGAMENMNSGNLFSAAARSPSSELSRQGPRESGGARPVSIHWPMVSAGHRGGVRAHTEARAG
jgi:hypothetical protein